MRLTFGLSRTRSGAGLALRRVQIRGAMRCLLQRLVGYRQAGLILNPNALRSWETRVVALSLRRSVARWVLP